MNHLAENIAAAALRLTTDDLASLRDHPLWTLRIL